MEHLHLHTLASSCFSDTACIGGQAALQLLCFCVGLQGTTTKNKEYEQNICDYSVLVNNCDDFKGRYDNITYSRGYYERFYKNHVCKIRIKMEPGDSGNWTCMLDDWNRHSGGSYRAGEQAEKHRNIRVYPNPKGSESLSPCLKVLVTFTYTPCLG